MRIITDNKIHAAATKLAWCAPVMTAGLFVQDSTCTKIRPVGSAGGPFGGAS